MSVTLRMKVTSYPDAVSQRRSTSKFTADRTWPDVRLALHRQTADVDPRLARLEGDEVADVAGRGVVEPESHPPILGSERGPSDSTQSKRTGRSERRSELARTARCPSSPERVDDAGRAAAPACSPAATPRLERVTRRIRYDAWSPGSGRTWTSPWCEPGFAFTELVASWSRDDPARHLDRGGRPGTRRPHLARARPLVVGAAADAEDQCRPATPRSTPTSGDRPGRARLSASAHSPPLGQCQPPRQGPRRGRQCR